MSTSSRRRVLLVEDDASMTQVLSRWFLSRGWSVVEAFHPDPEMAMYSACGLLRDNTPSVVVCDGLKGHYRGVWSMARSLGVRFILHTGEPPEDLTDLEVVVKDAHSLQRLSELLTAA